jgi:RND family efflux transporter MFP subunit
MSVDNRSLFALAAMALAGTILGCGHSKPAPQTTEHASAPRDSEVAPSVQTVSPERRPLVVKFEQPGIVEASESAALYSRASGYVRSVNVDIGDKVRADQVLLEVYVPELAQDLALKKALLTEAKTAVLQSKAGVAAARGALDSHTSQLALAQADLRKAESDFEFRRREHGRYAELAAKNASTAQLLDERYLVLRTAESACASAEARLKAVENEKVVLKARVASAEADEMKAEARVQVAEADRDKTNTIFDYANLKAPFDGVVTRRTVDVGEFVASPGSDRATPLFTLERIDPVTIVLRVPEKEVPAVHLGNRATVRLDGLQHRELSGSVTRLSQSLDPKSRTMRVEIDVANADGSIYPGMYGAVSLILADLDDALTVPAAALYSRDGELFVFQVRDDRVVRTKVRTGYDDGRVVQILEGLTGDENVIISNKGELSEGELVRTASTPKRVPNETRQVEVRRSPEQGAD